MNTFEYKLGSSCKSMQVKTIEGRVSALRSLQGTSHQYTHLYFCYMSDLIMEGNPDCAFDDICEQCKVGRLGDLYKYINKIMI